MSIVEEAMIFYDVLAYLGGCLLALCLIPQLMLMWTNRSAQDVSWSWTLLYSMGLSLSFLYLFLIDAVAGWISVLPELVLVFVVMISKKILDDNMEATVVEDTTGAGAGATGSVVDLPDSRDSNSKRSQSGQESNACCCPVAVRPSIGRLVRGAKLPTSEKIKGSFPVRKKIIGKHIYLDYYQLSFDGIALRDISKWLLRSIDSCFDYYQRTNLITTVTMLQAGNKMPVGFNIILKLQKFYITIFTCKNNESVDVDIGKDRDSSLVAGPSDGKDFYSLRFDIYHPEATSVEDTIPSVALPDLSTVDNEVCVTDNQVRHMADLIHISITTRFYATVFNIHNVVIQEKIIDPEEEKDDDVVIPISNDNSLLLYQTNMLPYDEGEGEEDVWISRSSSSDISISM